MSDNLKFFKGNEADLPIANSSNAGSIYHCEDTGNTYLSNGDQMVLFASAVGKTTSTNGGEVFNDYTTNIATGENSVVFGSAGETTNKVALYKINDYLYGCRSMPSLGYTSLASNQYVSANGVLTSKNYCYIRIYSIPKNADLHITYKYSYSTYFNYLPVNSPLVFLSTSSTSVAGLTSANTFLTKLSSHVASQSFNLDITTPSSGTYYLWVVYASYSSSSYYPYVYSWSSMQATGLKNSIIKDDNGNALVIDNPTIYQIKTNRILSNISTNPYQPTYVYYYRPRTLSANTHVSGLGTVAYAANQNVRGTYNTTATNAIEIVGNGTGPSNRSNAYFLTTDGRGYFKNHIFSNNIRVNSVMISGDYYTVDFTGGEESFQLYQDGEELYNTYKNAGYYFSAQDYLTCNVDEMNTIKLNYVKAEYYYDGNLDGQNYTFEGIWYDTKLTVTIFCGSSYDDEGNETLTASYTWFTSPVNDSNITVGLTKPDDSIGENGDLYIIPHNYTLPAIYSGTNLPTSAIGVDGDIYILYSEE